MRKELDNFIIESDTELDYFDEVTNYIVENEKKILDFFKLDKLPNKINVLILSYEPFKEWIVSKYGEILDYCSGDSDTPTNTVRILNIEDQKKYTTHKDASIEEIKGTALHEFVHQCHHQYHTDFRETTWFTEGLATNIANQDYELESLDECDFDKLKKDFHHYKNSYCYSYTIVNYVLNNYDEEEIEKLYKDPNYLRESADKIFHEAKVWVNNKNLNKSK